jgi:hypothetical protein
MYTLKLGLWERIQLDICLPRNAPLAEIRQLLRIMDVLALTDGEKESIGFENAIARTTQGQEFETVVYDEKKISSAESKPFSLETEDFNKLKALILARLNWPRDHRTIDLQDKIEAAVED